MLIEGDGHRWLALDYRQRKRDPEVLVIDAESQTSVQAAPSLSALIAMLRPYQEVYDDDGELRR